jgi:hypothetical protein
LKISSLYKIEAADLAKPTVIIMILANMFPLYGVLFLRWEVFPLLLLFWVENVIVGFFNVLKMLCCSPDKVGQWAAKVGMVPFFCLHYGIFTLVHGVFIFVLFGGFLNQEPFPDPGAVLRSIGNYQMVFAILALFLSHAISFGVNYIGKSEFKQKTVSDLMGEPYGRVIVLHVTIILGGFLIVALGSPVALLVPLVAFKTFVDIQAHLRQHNKATRGRITGAPANGV